MNELKFKISKVNGVEYLQIWEGNNFIRSCGNANKLNEKLVKLELLEEQTKKIEDFKTNFLSIKN